ncbi:MAG: hypothetical protein QME57_01160, partial [Patescibacteria group bacterium]|nr:hypothetical protein [Patescibacteria group bacterium]
MAECPSNTKEIDGRCVRALEITYPEIGGKPVPTTIESGLPEYINYIFTLAVSLIGFVIFGVLIYNGIKYLTSAGNLEQMIDAKSGIFHAFLGGLLLLSSVLIFNTINPQLKIMTLPEIEPLEQVVVPGVYICNYKVEKEEDIKQALETYITKSGQERNKAVEKLKEIMWNPKTEKGCPMVKFSGNFQNFQVTENGNTIFFVPSISEDPYTKVRTIKYEYGIVLHEKEDFRGQCDYFPKEDDNNLIYQTKEDSFYHPLENFSAKDLQFTAYSVTLFQKPSVEPAGDGVTLYRYFNYNRDEPEATTTDQKNFKPEG